MNKKKTYKSISHDSMMKEEGFGLLNKLCRAGVRRENSPRGNL